ncbi:MAG: murein biosynthesis integral membrane protein MurJ [Thermomicrobiales bacterium]
MSASTATVSPGRSFGRSASIVGLAFIASRVLGLAREVILARQFGTTGEYDAYVSAFRIPDLLFLIVMSGAFGAAFIPVFAGFLARDEQDRAWRLASAVLTLSAVTMVALSCITFALAAPIMQYLVAPDLPSHLHEVATETMRILLLSPILLGLGIAAKGILEAQEQFTLPALAPVFYNAAIIVAAVTVSSRWGVRGVAAGVVVGAGLHVLVQLPGLIRSGIRFTPTLDTSVAGLTEVGRLLLPRIIGLAAFQINFIVVNYLASGDGEGKISALNYAWQLMMLPHGVLAMSISTVVFPAMSRLFEQGDLDGVRRTFLHALEPLLLLILPASLGLFLFRTAIVQTVFEAGEFSGRSTHLVTDPLAFLAIGLIWYALVELLTRIFYAMHDTVTPVVSGVFIIVVNIVLGSILVGRLGHAGLGLSLSVSTAIEAGILLWVMRRRLGRFDPEFVSWFGKVAVSSAAMALAALAMRRALEDATVPGEAPRLLQIALLGYGMALVAGIFFLAAYYLRIPEVVRGADVVARRVQRLLGPRAPSVRDTQ